MDIWMKVWCISLDQNQMFIHMLSNNSNNRINLYLNNGKINNGALSVDQIAFISVKLKLQVYSYSYRAIFHHWKVRVFYGTVQGAEGISVVPSAATVVASVATVVEPSTAAEVVSWMCSRILLK